MDKVLKGISVLSEFFGLINGKWIPLVQTDPYYSQWQIYETFLLSAVGIALGWGNGRRATSPDSKNRTFWVAAMVFMLAIAVRFGYGILVVRWGASPPASDWGRAALGPTLVVGYGLIFGLLSLGFSLIGFGL